MMTQIFELPQPLLQQLAEKSTEIEVAVNAGSLPSYNVFVERLFKKMVLPEDNLIHAVLGVAGEAGELVDGIKKHWAYGKPLDIENVIEELGDLRFYYQSLLNMFGLTDDLICELNMHKLQKRYPAGVYSDSAAVARADKQPAIPGTDVDSVARLALVPTGK